MNNHMQEKVAVRRGGASWWAIGTAITAAIVVACGAFWASFTALSDLAKQAGWPRSQAFLLPVIVDGAIIAGTVAIVALRHHRRAEKVYAWAIVGAAAAVSIAANALHATINTGVSIERGVAAVLGAVAPTALLALTHLVVVLLRPAQEDDAFSVTMVQDSTFVTEGVAHGEDHDDAPPSATEVVELIAARADLGLETTYATVMAGWPETTQATASRRLRDARDVILNERAEEIDDELDTIGAVPEGTRLSVAPSDEEIIAAIVDSLDDKASGRTASPVTYRTVATAYGLSDSRARNLITRARKLARSLERAS